MEIFISTRYILVEAIFLMAFLWSLAGTYIHDIYLLIGRIIGIFTPRRLKQKEKDRQILEKSASENTTSPFVTAEDNIAHSEESEIKKSEDPSGVSDKSRLSAEKKEKLVELLILIRTRLARNEIQESRALIIEWLSIDKRHRELNILLASLYEKDGDYAKSEIVYRDLAKHYGEDEEVLSKLSNNLIILGKYEIAYEIEKKIIGITPSEAHIFIITGLAWELSHQEEALEYARTYLKQFPKNPDILWIKWQAEIALGMRKEAIEDLIKLKHLSPYNAELGELIQKLLMEEEMASNFNQ